MPRANRYYQEGFIYHITHRCNHRAFLLSRKKDKRAYRYWLYRSVQRYGLCVLNYIITDNHIHLLVLDTGEGVIPNSLRLTASRVAYDYHSRKKLDPGAFWEGRYFATAVQQEEYFMRCMVYISLNMVRCGVVSHPKEWLYGGYIEILNPRKRYRIIHEQALLALAGKVSRESFIENYNHLIAEAITNNNMQREAIWTEQRAVGDKHFRAMF